MGRSTAGDRSKPLSRAVCRPNVDPFRAAESSVLTVEGSLRRGYGGSPRAVGGAARRQGDGGTMAGTRGGARVRRRLWAAIVGVVMLALPALAPAAAPLAKW